MMIWVGNEFVFLGGSLQYTIASTLFPVSPYRVSDIIHAMYLGEAITCEA